MWNLLMTNHFNKQNRTLIKSQQIHFVHIWIGDLNSVHYELKCIQDRPLFL